MTAYENFSKADTRTRSSDSCGIHRTQLNRNNFPDRFDVIDRLRFLEIMVAWERGVRTNLLSHCFGISRKRASQDISLYRQSNPGAIEYDGHLKMYVPGPLFQPIYSTASEAEYVNIVNRLHHWNNSLVEMMIQTPGIDTMSYPQPATNRQTFSLVLQGIRRERRISIVVMEPREDDNLDYKRRSVVPLYLVKTHVGWHIRVFDESEGFDLIRLNRVFGDPVLGNRRPNVPADLSWNQYVAIVGSPKQDMSSDDLVMTNADWGIGQSKPLVVTARKPLAGLVLHFWERIDDRLTFTVVDSSYSEWHETS